jgi:hypothetical protein
MVTANVEEKWTFKDGQEVVSFFYSAAPEWEHSLADHPGLDEREGAHRRREKTKKKNWRPID